jgi:phage baseplate assembly protein gpV
VDGAAVSYDDGTNFVADPVFGREIVNDLVSATVLDEGGNAITVRYTPLLPTEAGYHLRAGSPAIDAGRDTAATTDIDGDARNAGSFDIGADEYAARTHDQLHVIAPNTGEVIPSGGTFTISWGAPAGAHHFSVALSRDNGATWTNIATNVTDTWFAWVAPRPRKNLTECLIRVTSFDAAGVRLDIDASNEPFTVEVVKLLVPNGGEVLVGGLQYNMVWKTNATSEPVTSVNIEWSRDGGATWSLRGSPANNPGSFGWFAPPVDGLGTEVLLRITLLAGTTVVGQDQTDMPLTIRPPLVP